MFLYRNFLKCVHSNEIDNDELLELASGSLKQCQFYLQSINFLAVEGSVLSADKKRNELGSQDSYRSG